MSEVVEVAPGNAITVIEVDQSVISLGGTQVIEVGYLQPGGSVGDKYYNQDFNAENPIAVNHGLHKHPAVHVEDTAGTEVIVDIDHVDDDNLTITYVGLTSGTIYCN